MITLNKCIAERRGDWQKAMERIQSAPLALCPSFPEVAERWNDWWAFKADRPLIVAKARAARTQEIRWDKAFDCLEKPVTVHSIWGLNT